MLVRSYRKRNAPAICGELITYLRGCRCLLCRKANADYNKKHRAIRGKEYVRNCNLKQAYGLSLDEYTDMSIKQNNVCASCKQSEIGKNQYGELPLAVDHDHDSGQIRGLLCIKCNRALGLLGDSISNLERLLAYRRSFV